MSFHPLTPDEEKKALSRIGVRATEDLFASIPPKIRENADFTVDIGGKLGSVDRGLTEHELRKFFGELASRNASHFCHFLGGGVYDNIIPALVNQLVLRGEFLTCYTPYQPEMSQGTLQAIFEFQTLITRMTAMEVANASMYDGASATAEAVWMALRLAGMGRQHVETASQNVETASRPSKQRQSILVAASLHPDYKRVTQTFLRAHSKPPTEIRWTPQGTIDLEHLKEQLQANEPRAVVIGYPNYFGVIEPLDAIRKLLPADCLFIVSVADPTALSIFEAPGTYGADIVVGEAHQLGTPMLFGGPHVGFFASRRKYLRQMPGRLVGETLDAKQNRAYTLTLATREQHIRRDKATSNICTNQGLMALRTTIYLSFLGKRGFVRLGESNYSKMQYLIEELESHGIPLKFKETVHYREAVFEVPNLEKRFSKCVHRSIVPGIALGRHWPSDFESCLLVSVHPKHTKEDLDRLVESISSDE